MGQKILTEVQTAPPLTQSVVGEREKVPELTSLIQPDYFNKLLKDPDELSPDKDCSSEDSETQSDTSSNDSIEHEASVKPIIDILNVSSFNSFVINSQAGLSGTTTIATYPCVLTATKFFVWLGATSITVFDKSTFMNLANLAEKEGATDMYLILERSNQHKQNFRKMFRVIDAERLTSPQTQELIK